jgi:hypothetical protein
VARFRRSQLMHISGRSDRNVAGDVLRLHRPAIDSDVGVLARAGEEPD